MLYNLHYHPQLGNSIGSLFHQREKDHSIQDNDRNFINEHVNQTHTLQIPLPFQHCTFDLTLVVIPKSRDGSSYDMTLDEISMEQFDLNTSSDTKQKENSNDQQILLDP